MPLTSWFFAEKQSPDYGQQRNGNHSADHKDQFARRGIDRELPRGQIVRHLSKEQRQAIHADFAPTAAARKSSPGLRLNKRLHEGFSSATGAAGSSSVSVPAEMFNRCIR